MALGMTKGAVMLSKLLKRKVIRYSLIALILLWFSTAGLDYYQDYAQITVDSVQSIQDVDEFGAYQVVGHTRLTSYVLSCYNEKDFKCFVPSVRHQYSFQKETDHQIWFKESPDYSLTWLVDSETTR
jgi:hypothetical protein